MLNLNGGRTSTDNTERFRRPKSTSKVSIDQFYAMKKIHMKFITDSHDFWIVPTFNTYVSKFYDNFMFRKKLEIL